MKTTPIKVMIWIILASFFFAQLSAVIYYYSTPKAIAVSQQKGKIGNVIYDCVISEQVINKDNTIYMLIENDTVIGERYTVYQQDAIVLASENGLVALSIDPLYKNYLIVTACEGVLVNGMEVIINS